MIIETKYNIGDKVWYVDKSAKCRVVDAIKVEQKWRELEMGWVGEPVTKYWVDCEWWFESELYPTKEELLKSL